MAHAYASLHRAKMEAYNQLVLIGKQSLEVLTSDGGEALFSFYYWSLVSVIILIE